MAGEVDDIVQNIVLTGNEDVAAAFDRIRDAGETAFEAVSKAIEHSAFSFTGFVTAIGGVTAAIGALGVGAFLFEKSTAESVSSLSDLADQTGQTTEEITGLKAAFAAGGIGGQEMEQAFKRLAVSIQQSWTEIKAASREGSDKLRGDALSVRNAELALADAQRKNADIANDQALRDRANSQGVAEARLRLAELNGQDVSDQREALQIRQARLALDNAIKKQAEDAANAEAERQKAVIAAEQAQLALRQARRKEEDDKKNDITNIIDAVKKTGEGDTGALKNVNASADNIAKGIIGAAAEAGHSLDNLRGDITDLSSPAPGVKETFLEIGKVLSNIEDPALKTAVAFRLLGRTVSQDFLNVISNPEKMKEFQDRIQSLGLGVDELDKKISEQFREALFTLQNDISLIGVKIGTALGPALTTAVRAIDDAITNNKDVFIEWSQIIGGKVSSVIQSFVRVLSGVPEAGTDDWLVGYTSKLEDFGYAVGSAVGIFTTAVGALVSGAGKIADALNGVFGTNLNGFDVLLSLWVGKIVLGFGTVVQAAIAAGTGVGVAFAPVLAGLGLLTAAVYTTVKAWQALSDAFSLQGQSSHLEAMLDGAQKRLSALAEFMSGDFKKGIEDWKAANEAQAAAEANIDSVDAQIKENRRRRDAELAKASMDSTKSVEEDNKKSLNRIDEDHKKSVENRSAQQKRLDDTAKGATQQQTPDNTGGPSSVANGGTGIDPSNLAAQAAQFSKKTGQPLSDLSAFGDFIKFGNAGVVRGFQTGAGKEITEPTKPEDLPGAVKDGTKEGAKEGVIEGLQSSGLTGGKDRGDNNNVVPREEPRQAQQPTPQESTQPTTPQGLREKSGVVNIPQGASQKAINEALNKPTISDTTPQEPLLNPEDVRSALDKLHSVGDSFKKLRETDASAADIAEGLSDRSDGSVKGRRPGTIGERDRMFENQLQGLERDFARQADLNRQVIEQNGGKVFSGKNKDGVSTSYPPPVPGRYDPDTQQFIPSNPKNVGPGMMPRTNDYDFAGKRNPIPYQPGISTPLTFKKYNKELEDELKKEGIPLPKPRPPEADAATDSVPLPRSRPTESNATSADEVKKQVVQQAVDRIAGTGGLNTLRSGEGPTQIPQGEPFPSLPQPERPPLSRDLNPFAPDTGAAPGNLGDFLKSLLPQPTGELPPVQPLDTTRTTPLAETPDFASTMQDLKSAIESLKSVAQPQQAPQTLPSLEAPPIQPLDAAAPPQQTEAAKSSFQSFIDSVISAINDAQSKIQGKQDNTVTGPTDGLGIRGDAVDQLDSSLADAGQSIDGLGGSLDGLGNTMEELRSSASAAASVLREMTSGSGTVEVATGGHIRGAGTETSDSIPALLSHNEYVHRAAAVRHYGVDFMHAINNMHIPRFNVGGLVGLLSPQLPRFRDGGVVSVPTQGGGRMEHLGTVDLTTDHGNIRVGVDRNGLTQLRRASVMRNIGSERKSSWVK